MYSSKPHKLKVLQIVKEGKETEPGRVKEGRSAKERKLGREREASFLSLCLSLLRESEQLAQR